MTTKVTKSGVGAIDQLAVGSIKHASSPVDNITLDANGNVILPYSKSLAFNGIANQYVYADADNLYLGTSNLGRLRIDTSGRVTMPYQPMFYAQHNATETSSGQYGRWDYEFVNVGNHASHAAHTGSYVHTRWYAPVTGKYLVWVGNIGPNASTTQRTRIVVNGTDKSAQLRTHQDANHGTSASMMAIVSAAAGDWISAHSTSDGGQLGFYSGSYSHFGVQLIG